MLKSKPTPKTSDKQRHFDVVFKLQASLLAKQIDFHQAADDLGMSEGKFRNWEKSIAPHYSADARFLRCIYGGPSTTA
jgi:hypothetical protein